MAPFSQLSIGISVQLVLSQLYYYSIIIEEFQIRFQKEICGKEFDQKYFDFSAPQCFSILPGLLFHSFLEFQTPTSFQIE